MPGVGSGKVTLITAFHNLRSLTSAGEIMTAACIKYDMGLSSWLQSWSVPALQCMVFP